MRHYNMDVEEAERNYSSFGDELEVEDGPKNGSCRSFFDLRQRSLVGVDQMSAFRIVALGVLRKLRTNVKGSVLYSEVEDALNRYCRLLEADMQKFASLHETLQEAATRQTQSSGSATASAGTSAGAAGKRGQTQSGVSANSAGAASLAAARSILSDGMREIAVVLLACGEMQRRALDLKMSAQRSIAETDEDVAPLLSFSRYADFLEEALAVSDQLRRKHEELQQQRIRAMERAVEARAAGAASAPSSVSPRRPASARAAAAAAAASAAAGAFF